MAELGQSFVLALVAALVWQRIMFMIGKRLERIDVVDVGWGLTFIVIAVVMAILHSPVNIAGAIVMALVIMWGGRLSWHIGQRFRRSRLQDPRYTNLVRHYSPLLFWVHVYVRIFIVQALLATIISLPVIVVLTAQPAMSMVAYAGMAVWIVGFVCEVVADAQLKSFLRTAKKNELMMTGLWKYSRHPNYFGEMLMWWGLAIFSCTTPYGWLGIVGALVITALLAFVSGVPPAEARAASKKGWKAYKASTSVLVPWWPRG
jgi:steroid 5-alpha reductase family enzyme